MSSQNRVYLETDAGNRDFCIQPQIFLNRIDRTISFHLVSSGTQNRIYRYVWPEPVLLAVLHQPGKTELVWKCQENACGFGQKTANKNMIV